jgi:filamentous hemagglutinin family protein
MRGKCDFLKTSKIIGLLEQLALLPFWKLKKSAFSTYMNGKLSQNENLRSKPWKVASACAMSALLLFGQTAPVLGNPTGGQVVAGSASITNAGATLNINQGSDKAIINWQNFSINSGELTKFLVPSNTSATLNRVLGGNPSAIYGTLQSNGQLFLINPSGIVVGASGRIDTAGFLGSTLNVSDSEFLSGGDLHFVGTSGASIDNQGTIHAASGDVYLLANQVGNSGTLSAPQGNVGLAAGTDILLQQAGDQHLFVQPGASASTATGVTNSGSVQAATAELKAAGGNAYALAINNSGNIAVTGFKKVNGQVYLTADGGNITNSGQISAQNPNGDGGTIVLNGHGNSPTGTVLSSGKLIASGKARGTQGGTVQVLGNQVGIMDHGVVDVSGDAGGGTALIGGDEHGANPAIPDAEQTYVGPDAQITADALTLGNGGKIILWGNETTQAYGKLSARGGALGGNGGFVETSAPSLDVQTVPDVSAPHGQGGTWLLDPSDIFISDSVTTTPGFSAPFAISIGSVFDLNQSDLLAALMSGNVTLDASGGSGGNGTITWQQSSGIFDISNIPGNTLTLNAPAQMPTSNISTGILLSGMTITSVSGTGSLNLVLNSSNSSSNVQILNSTLQLNGGSLTAYGTGFASVTSSTSLNNSDGIYIGNDLIDAQGGNITMNGNAGYYFNNDPQINNVSAGYGVHVDHSVIQTSGAGGITLTGNGSMPANGTTVPTGTFTSSFTSMVGVAIYNGSALSVSSGNISITGTISQGTATGILHVNPDLSQDVVGGELFGVDIEGGSQIGSTGNGSVSITGNTSGSTATVENTGVYLTGGASNSNSNSPTPTTTLVTAAGGPGITITGTSGTVANSVSGVNSQSLDADGIRLDNGVSIAASGSAPVTLMGTGGTDTNIDPTLKDGNAGGIEVDAYGNSNGNMGNGGTTDDSISSVSGAILLTGIGGSSMRSVDGVSIDSENGGFSSITSTSGNITLNGSVPNQTMSQANMTNGGDEGVGLSGDNSTGSFSSVTALAGSINITGTVSSGTANSKEAGVVVTGGSQVTAQGTGGTGALAQGDVTLQGDTTGSTAESLEAGVFVEGQGTMVSASGTTANAAGHTGLTIIGTSSTLNGTTGGNIDNNNGHGANPGYYLNPLIAGIGLLNGAKLQTTGAAPMTLNGTGGANNNTDPTSGSYGVAVFSPLASTTTSIAGGSGLISITGQAGSNPNAGTGILLGGGASNVGSVSVTTTGAFNATALSGTGVSIDATVNAASSTLGSAGMTSGQLIINNSSITLSGGAFTAYGAGVVANQDGVDITNSSIDTQGGMLTLVGQQAGTMNVYGVNVRTTSTLNAGTGALDVTTLAGSNIWLNATMTAQSATLGTASTGSLQIENGSLTLSGGDLIGYGAGTAQSVDGVDVYGSTINTQGGNIFLTGKAGYYFNGSAPAPGNTAGWGVFVGVNSVLETTAPNQSFTTGNITIVGDGSQSITAINDLTGVEIYNGRLSVVNGAISVIGNVNSGTSQNISNQYVSYTSGVGDGPVGILVDGGSNIAATGTGSVSLVGNTTGSISDASGSSTADHDNSGVHITGQNTTISANGGGITIIGNSGSIINNSGAGASTALDVSIGPFQSSGIPTLNAGTGNLLIDPVVTGNGINVVANITAGTTTLSDPGQEVDVFNNGSSDFGVLNLIANTATIYQVAPINLGVVSVNNLTLISKGNITQTGPLTTSLLSAAAGGSITLTNPGNSITQLGPINQTSGAMITSGGSPLVPTINNGSQIFAFNVRGTPYMINLNQVNNIPALGITIQPIGNQIQAAVGNIGGGTMAGQQVAAILPINNQVAPQNPLSFNTGILVTDTSTLGSDISYNPQGGTSPIFQNVSTLGGASSGDSDVGPGDVVQVGGGSVSSTKMPPAVAGALQGALNNQVRQDLSNALHGH